MGFEVCVLSYGVLLEWVLFLSWVSCFLALLDRCLVMGALGSGFSFEFWLSGSECMGLGF